jgi:DNA-binding transcriptional ArsR family regulator
MKNKKYILVSMDDDRIKSIAEVLGNKTSKKIIDFLSETNESSEKDIADSLGMPINTIEYNLKKLLKSELIEKSSNFFWSKKGKKIDLYRISNKSIVISPKATRISSAIKSFLPVGIIGGALGLLGSYFANSFKAISQVSIMKDSSELLTTASQAASEDTSNAIINATQNLSSASALWWFLGGALAAILIFSLVKLAFTEMKGGNKK